MRVAADSVEQQQRVLLGVLLWTGLASVVVYVVLYLTFGLWGPLIAESTYMVFTVLTLVAYYRRPQWQLGIVHFQVLAILAITFFNTILLGGFEESGGWIMYGVVAPVGALVFLKTPYTWLYTLGFIADVVVCASGVVELDRTWPFPEEWQSWLMAVNLIGSFILVDLTLGFFFRRFQEERRRSEATMELAVRGQKLESLGTLAAGIAHDFNNILMAFLGHVVLARKGLPADGPEAQHLRQAEAAINQATALTSQLLTFSRGGAPVRKAASILEVIRDSSTFVLHGTASRCNFRLAPELWPVEADRSQISQLVQNLVLNAHQAMPNGGTVQVRARNLPAGLDAAGLDPRRRYVHIEIEDTGVGIPVELRDKVFEPFFTTRHDGTGLGLTSAHSIVRNHEGLITLDSEPGRGTTFHIWLPAADTMPIPIQAEPDNGSVPAGPVLVMDDEEGVLEVLLEMLDGMGVRAVGATTADEAIRQYGEALARGARFRTVILDLTLPGGRGGVEVAQEILLLDPRARIIASSGYADNQVFSDPGRYGFMDVLRKPYRPEELERVVAEARA